MTKYMLIWRPTDAALDALSAVPPEELHERIGRFTEDLTRAGVLLAAEGLDDPSEGVVVDFTGEAPVVTDGPYGETKELFAGFYILDVASKDEAIEWAKRTPSSQWSVVEIRRIPRIDEFPEDNEWIQKERSWREVTGQL